MPRLSILVATTPSRNEMTAKLVAHIEELIGDRDIEVLYLGDNRKRSIGAKREALKNISNGDFFLFNDSDDTLLSISEVYDAICENPKVDVITFKQKCRNPDGSEFTITFGLGNEVEHRSEDGRYLDCKRPPFHVCAWNKRFKKIKFPDISYAEDAVFVEEANKLAKTSVHLDVVVNTYDFDPAITEASTKSNEFWTNPNDLPPIKRAIVNLITKNNPAYEQGQLRLKNSLKKHFHDEVFLFTGEDFVGAPMHSESPYAFKLFAMKAVREMGYNQILWLDASVVAVKDVMPVFDWLTEHEVFAELAGHWAGTWSPQYVLDFFGKTMEEAMTIPLCAGGYVGFDFRTSMAQEVFAFWCESERNGMFKGGHDISRHDMTCLGLTLDRYGLRDRFSPGGTYFAYRGEQYEKPKPTAVFELWGL